ncbi:MAG TPA: permease prefix domain 1-containing protein [Anaerolineales bacterium]|nr:permease prefix domain 1-containing protein [Anaerolineales bacterium]
MKENRIQDYLRKLQRQLWLHDLADADILAEIESHLLEGVEAGLHQGLSIEKAEQQALERFGTVKLVAGTFEKERKHGMQNVLLAVAVLAGLFSAYVDSRPTWDDTGILAGGLLLISGLLTLLGHRKPWLIALAVGIWIPLHDIYLSHDLRMLLVLLFPLVGAYAGWAFRLGIRKTFDLA